MPHLYKPFSFVFVAAIVLTATQAFSAEKLDFAHDVVPILKKHCLECHGGANSKGGFSINTRRLFLDDDRAVPGDPEASYFLELINSEDKEYQMPPPGKPRVSPAELATLTAWVKAEMPWEETFSFAPPVYEPPLKPRRVTLPPAIGNRTNPVDRLLDHYLTEQKLPTPQPLNDAEFLRRVHLDLVGLLPTAEARAAFLEDNAPDKRARLIDQLLDNKTAYTEHWLTFWNDLLRNDYAGTGFITGGRKQISGWLYNALLENKPYDEFARDLLAPPSPASAGFIGGIKWRGDVSAGQTVEIQFAQSVSQSFLGLNMKCASCHDSFISRWKLSEAYGLAAIYANRKLEIHRCDKPVGTIAKAGWLFPELGKIDPAAPQPERLKQLAKLMTHPENGRFTRTIVNRLWAQLMGRGIVHPLDAMQTEPWNEDLLDFLAMDFQEKNYDLKATLRLIANSQAYQSRTVVQKADAAVEAYVYQGPLAKRLTAEQFVDAIWQLTDSAPGKPDAPVNRPALPQRPGAASSATSLKPQWIWHPSAKQNTPAAGETVYFTKTFELKEKPAAATAAVTVDNEYKVYVNGKQAAQDTSWESLERIDVSKLLRQGENRIVLVARNAGAEPNLAGAFFGLSVNLASGKSTGIVSDATWLATKTAPQETPVANWDWSKIATSPAFVLSETVWNGTIRPQLAAGGRPSPSNLPPVRASLLKSNFLMTTLGRPNRDQIVSSRPNEITTLEALDLSNNPELAKWLNNGAKRILAAKPADTAVLVRSLYHQTLTREPTQAELHTLQAALGDQPAEAAVADVLWVLVMSPEFIFVR